MHNFEVHSNESACRKSGPLMLDQVRSQLSKQDNHYKEDRNKNERVNQRKQREKKINLGPFSVS